MLEAVARAISTCETGRKSLTERNIDRAFQFAVVVVAITGLGISLEPAGRLRSAVEDSAAGRIAPEQRTLRPLENLNGFEIEKRGCGAATSWHIVEIANDRWSRVGEGIDRLAADGKVELIRRTCLPHCKPGSCDLKIDFRDDPPLYQLLFAECRNRDRNVLQTLVGATRCNDDFARRRLFRSAGLLRRGSACKREQRNGSAAKQSRFDSTDALHARSPRYRPFLDPNLRQIIMLEMNNRLFFIQRQGTNLPGE